jgi:hypothetical protein
MSGIIGLVTRRSGLSVMMDPARLTGRTL